VLVGGSGYSDLYGGSAGNLLIAGTGRGWLHAGSAGDILIDGYTSYDSNTTALAYIMAEWDSSDSYSTRVKTISNGGGLNGSYVLDSTTVFDNGVSDSLYGGAGPDWFFAHTRGKTNKDHIYNRTSGEVVTNI
jgi:Ca2+-binding RTX toxin-like protein